MVILCWRFFFFFFFSFIFLKHLVGCRHCSILQIDFSRITTYDFDNFTVEIVDSVNDYVELVKDIFDFDQIKAFFARRPDFKVLFDGMNGGMLTSEI